MVKSSTNFADGMLVPKDTLIEPNGAELFIHKVWSFSSLRYLQLILMFKTTEKDTEQGLRATHCKE